MNFSELMDCAKSNKNIYAGEWLSKRKPRQHGSKFLISMGRLWPTTKAQVKYFVKERIFLDVIGLKDACNIEVVLNKYGKKGIYKLTKGKNWCRLENQGDLFECFKKELLAQE